MILHDLDAIFIHIPKTAGNFLTKQVFGRYSRDRIVRRSFHQDLEQRFEVSGDVTVGKHMMLADYASVLDISRYYVIAGCRDPFDRMISLYFSPHRWFQKQWWWRLSRAVSGTPLTHVLGPGYAALQPRFDVHSFKRLVEGAPTQQTFLKGHERSRGLFLIRSENVAGDCERVARYFGITIDVDFDIRVNKSDKTFSGPEADAAREIAANSAHEDDRPFIDHLVANAWDGAARGYESIRRSMASS